MNGVYFMRMLSPLGINAQMWCHYYCTIFVWSVNKKAVLSTRKPFKPYLGGWVHGCVCICVHFNTKIAGHVFTKLCR